MNKRSGLGISSARRLQDARAALAGPSEATAPKYSLADFCRDAERTGLTVDALADALRDRPEFATFETATGTVAAVPSEGISSVAASDGSNQLLGLLAIQADEIRKVLDELAPETVGNLQTRLRDALVAASDESLSRQSSEAAESHRSTRNTQESVRSVIDWQKKALDAGFQYWRASDAHGVECTIEQATALLRDLLGVEVDFKAATTEPSPRTKP